MKTIKHLNTFAIELPFGILITYPIFKESSILYALISTMVTGFIQVFLAIWMLHNDTNNLKIKIYITSVIGFFTLWLINAQMNYNNTLSFLLITIPLILAIYLSIIIHKK